MADEWKDLSLREAGVQLLDCDHKTPAANESGRPYIAIPQLKAGRIDPTDARRITEIDFEKWTRKTRPQAWDVVVSRRCNPGETAFVPPGFEFALGQNLVILRSNGKSVFPPFLRWLLRSPKWWEQVNTFINVGAVFESLKCADIPNFRLPIPPLIEQQAIACILGALDDKIELNRRRNQTLEAMARAIFQSWFVDFDPVKAKAAGRTPHGLKPQLAALFPNAFEDSSLGPIPSGWRVAALGDCVSRVAMGPFGSSIKTENFVDAGVPVIRGGNLTAGFVDEGFVFLLESKADELRNANAFPGDVVITHRGTLGQVGLIPAKARFARYVVSQSQMLVRPKHEVLPSHYLYLFLTSKKGQHSLLANTSQTGVPAIAQPTASVKAIRLICPAESVVAKFESVVAMIFDALTQHEQESSALATLRDTLLPKLISGELRVPDAERIVGRVA